MRLWAAASQLQAIEIQAEWVLNQSFPRTAQGIYLDYHGQMRGVQRQGAARAQEMGGGKRRVLFPEVAGIPADFERIERIVPEILLCHSDEEFYFRYLTWEECHRAGYTWADLDPAEHTWESFQVAVPPIDETAVM